MGTTASIVAGLTQLIKGRRLMSEKERALIRGCVVRMKSSSGLVGYGNEQCVSSVCDPLETLSLFGHNQHYKIYDVAEVIEYPAVEKGLSKT